MMPLLIFITFVLTLVLQPVKANMLDTEALKACKDYAALAENIMTLRQQDVPLLQALQKEGDTDLGEVLVLKAYHERNYVEKDSARRAANTFGEQVLLRCIVAAKTMAAPERLQKQKEIVAE